VQQADNGDWLMSLVAGEGSPTYRYFGVAYRVLEKQDASKATRALYRCTDAHGTHYQTTNLKCESEGSTLEGLLGYIYADDPGDGARKLFRCISPTGRPIITTADPSSDCTIGGFIVQLVLGWAYPATYVQP
jgi:hypothetical protein